MFDGGLEGGLGVGVVEGEGDFAGWVGGGDGDGGDLLSDGPFAAAVFGAGEGDVSVAVAGEGLGLLCSVGGSVDGGSFAL